MRKRHVGKFIIYFISIIIIYKTWSIFKNTESVPTQYVGRHILSRFNCSPKAIKNFPPDLFTAGQRKSGILVVHILVALYMFVGLALVCEDYFVPCLEVICENLKLQPDVAGATFMAAGSSAPELATTMIGVFVAKDDIGLGAVVGSADYNLMLVIGLSALFAPVNTMLNWWPLFRDCFFYSLSIIILIISIYDSYVHWYEALVMLIFYGFYILLNAFNPSLEVWVKLKMSKYMPCCTLLNNAAVSSDETFLMNSTDSAVGSRLEICSEEQPQNSVDVDSDISDGSDLHSNSQQQNQQHIRLKRNRSLVTRCHGCFSVLVCPPCCSISEDNVNQNQNQCCRCSLSQCWSVFYTIICWPLRLLLCITTPDCRLPYFRSWFWITFFMSCVWISLYSYVMIWMITIVGDTLNIPDTVMGLTFIAAGSSVPDAIASVLVVKEGQGDMAVSNAVGSNVFDILICLGLPWFLKCIISGKSIDVYSKGLLYATLTLFSTVFLLLIITHLYKWRMSRNYGLILILIYLLFLIICTLYETNTFGPFHPETCKT